MICNSGPLVQFHATLHFLARRCETIPRPTSTEIELFDMNLDGNKVFSYQEVAQYRCIPGHIATSGNARRRCMADGKVNGKDLTCEGKCRETYVNYGHDYLRLAISPINRQQGY